MVIAVIDHFLVVTESVMGPINYTTSCEKPLSGVGVGFILLGLMVILENASQKRMLVELSSSIKTLMDV